MNQPGAYPPPPAPAGYQPTKTTRRKGLLFGSCITVLILLVIWFGLGIKSFLDGFNSISTGGDGDQQFEEIYVRGDGDDKIAVINIHGIILSDGDGQGGLSGREIQRMLDRARTDDTVKAVIVDIDSPGGAVVASRQIYEKIKQVRDTKPVIAVYSGDVAASGGVYVSMGATRIISDPETLTGSIGVIAEYLDISGLLDKYGVHANTIKSGKFKDTGNMFRAMTDEERAMLQDLIDESYANFVQVVADGRSQTVEQVKTYADGRVFSGATAQTLGLVDSLGTREDAEQLARDIAGLTDAQIIEYAPYFDIGSFFGLASAKLKPINELSIIQTIRENNLRMMYLLQ